MLESNRYSQRDLLVRLWAYYRPYKAILFSDLAAVLLLAAIGVAVPWFLKVIVDTAVPARDFGLVLRIALVVGLLALVKYGAEFYTLYAGHAMAADFACTSDVGCPWAMGKSSCFPSGPRATRP